MNATFCDVCGKVIEDKNKEYKLELTRKEESQFKGWYGMYLNQNVKSVKQHIIRTMDLCEECAIKIEQYTDYEIGEIKEINDL